MCSRWCWYLKGSHPVLWRQPKAHVAPLARAQDMTGRRYTSVLQAFQKDFLVCTSTSCQASNHSLCCRPPGRLQPAVFVRPGRGLKPPDLPCRPPRRPSWVPTTWPNAWRSTTQCCSVDVPAPAPMSSSWTSGRWSRRLVSAKLATVAVQGGICRGPSDVEAPCVGWRRLFLSPRQVCSRPADEPEATRSGQRLCGWSA